MCSEERADSPTVGKSKFLAQEPENPFDEPAEGAGSSSGAAGAGGGDGRSGKKGGKAAGAPDWDSISLDSPKLKK